jgi:hypothetical protein
MNLAEQLEDARAGSAAAQKALFDHLADSMMALCCRYVKNRADAEELNVSPPTFSPNIPTDAPFAILTATRSSPAAPRKRMDLGSAPAFTLGGRVHLVRDDDF